MLSDHLPNPGISVRVPSSSTGCVIDPAGGVVQNGVQIVVPPIPEQACMLASMCNRIAGKGRRGVVAGVFLAAAVFFTKPAPAAPSSPACS